MTDVYLYRLKKNREFLLRDLEPRQVLNYLYQEDVIDADDRDDVKSERTRKRQAEALLDMLERRGPNAVHYLVKGLQKSSQKYLAEVLSKPSTNEDGDKTGISKSVITSDDHYKMDPNHNPCGLALIINNFKFDNRVNEGKPLFTERVGSEKDVDKMRLLFEYLRFEVTTKTNYTVEEMRQVIRHFALEDHSNYDCFVLFIMSHGNKEGIYGKDCEILCLDYIKSFFTAKFSPTLAGKPKLFFFQSCRGRYADEGVNVTEAPGSPSAGPIPETQVQVQPPGLNVTESGFASKMMIPNETDTFFAFASSPNYAALRNIATGGWFVDEIFHVMMRYASGEDLESMMTKVKDKVASHKTKNFEMQSPETCSQLRKKLFFLPK